MQINKEAPSPIKLDPFVTPSPPVRKHVRPSETTVLMPHHFISVYSPDKKALTPREYTVVPPKSPR